MSTISVYCRLSADSATNFGRVDFRVARTIESDVCLDMLRSLQIGSPIAEQDTLLFESRVETSVFSELVTDSIDIVRGTKGSGKSALFRLFADFGSIFLDKRTVSIKAVETRGDPIFLKFRPEFETFDEIDFENFWRIYFISVVTSQFFGSEQFATYVRGSRRNVSKFRALAKANGFPIKESAFSVPGLVAWVLGKVPRVKKISAAVDPESSAPEMGIEFEARAVSEERVPIFVAALQESLLTVLRAADIRLWIMLDRLDEAFPRRSAIERTALRALLRATQAFNDDHVRLKIFLRDDIFDSITDTEGGFVALTHIMARCSHVLRWNREQILQLITNRIYLENSPATRFFKVDRERLSRDETYRLECFYHIFPRRLKAGARQSTTLDWLYKHCEDANGVVTPRDVIDLINFARHYQADFVRSNQTTSECLLSPAAILHGHREMSMKKRESYLKAEFEHFWRVIERFENQKAEHDEVSLRRLLGDDFRHVKDLRSIGFLKHNPGTKTYSIPFLYRPGLGIRQGKSTAGKRGEDRRTA